jgi:limonene-1,2-epoxide hydrolase
MANARKVATDFLQALGAGDFTAARKLLRDDLTFRGPIDTFHSPEPYIESLKKLHDIIQRVDVKRIFADGDDACILYDMVTNTPAGTAFIAEWYQVKDDKIAEIRVVFDARPFAAMFAKQAP